MLADFSVGRYDIDIGRGARAAYIRFADKFQVWMIKADLIDLSTNVADWTYGSLWNLRFGRLSGFNRTSNLNRTAEMVKTLLNVGFVSAAEGKPEGEKFCRLNLKLKAAGKSELTFANKEHIYARYQFRPEDESGYLGFLPERRKMPL